MGDVVILLIVRRLVLVSLVVLDVGVGICIRDVWILCVVNGMMVIEVVELNWLFWMIVIGVVCWCRYYVLLWCGCCCVVC